MNDSLTSSSRPPISLEVQEFAAAKGVSQYIDAVIDLARQAFPTSSMVISVGEDAEDETYRYIALDVRVTGLTSQELMDNQRIWSNGLGHVCPRYLGVYFVLGWQ